MRIKALSILIVLLATLQSCDEIRYPDDEFSVSNLSYGDCKPDDKSENNEYLLLWVANDYFLNIDHINAIFNCEPGEIIVRARVEGKDIIIDEYSTQNLANCICPYDLKFNIGPIPYDTYNLIIMNSGMEIFNTEIDFDTNLNIKLNID